MEKNNNNNRKKNSSSGFWGAAKKWQIWKQKHNTTSFTTTILPVEKPVFSQYRETDQSSCRYAQPRFSLDLGRRISSFDGPKSTTTFDAPRASWDGGRITNNLPRIFFEENAAPGGSDQTRNYYLDTSSSSSSSSSSKRRKSLDRSTSLRIRNSTAEQSMVSPTTAHYLNFLPNTADDPNTIISLRDGCKDTTRVDGKESKKSRKWNWKLWGRNKLKTEMRTPHTLARVNGVDVDRSLSDLRREGSGFFNEKMFRSNSSVSWRNANILGGPIDLGRKSAVEMNERRDHFGLEKNSSTRYSQNHVANRLIYLTPTEGQQKRRSG